MDFIKICQTSILKTIIINCKYFGLRGLFCPQIICSRYVKLQQLAGRVICDEPKIGNIRVGFKYIGIADSKYQRTIWDNTGVIHFHGSTQIGSGNKIICSGNVELGNNFIMTGNSSIIAMKDIRFGNDCLVSWDCLFMDSDFHKICSINNNITNSDQPIIIKNNVWIGCRSLILKGAIIEPGTVIAANSVVTKKLPEGNSLYVSHQIVKHNIIWKY